MGELACSQGLALELALELTLAPVAVRLGEPMAAAKPAQVPGRERQARPAAKPAH